MKRIIISILLLLNYLLVFTQVNSTTKPWTGKVVDTLNQPVPNLNIVISDIGLSTVSNQDGDFLFQVPFEKSGTAISITLTGTNYEIVNAKKGDTKLKVIDEKIKDTINITELNLLTINVKRRPMECTMINPEIQKNSTWCDTVMYTWFSECTGGLDVSCPVSGRILNPPINGQVDLYINLPTGESWSQGTYNINKDGTWDGTVNLRTTNSSGQKYFEKRFNKTFQIIVLDQNKNKKETFNYLIKSCQ